MTSYRYARLWMVVCAVVAMAAIPAMAQEKPFLTREASAANHQPQEECRGAVTLVTDVGSEALLTTSHNWSSATGGGESKRFDKTPILSTRVELKEGCLNAHFSALVGSSQMYGGVSDMAFFQVTLTPAGSAVPQHMFGHWDTPYGTYGPAVIIEAEKDVDQISANFFQRIGDGPGEVKPGSYLVDVWWAGGPNTPGGAIGTAFVLKLYQ